MTYEELTPEQIEALTRFIHELAERVRKILDAFREALAIFADWINDQWVLHFYAGLSAHNNPHYWLMWSARRSLVRLE